MQSIKGSILARKEILNQIHKAKSIDYKNKHRFYLPDEFIDSYMKAIKTAYQSGTYARMILAIFAVLARHSNKDGISYPSHETIMEKTCISNKNQLVAMLKIMREELKMFEYLQGKGKSPNVYKLIDIKFWTSASSIIPKVSSIKKQVSQYQAADTRRSSKELLYKEQENFLKLLPGPQYKLLCRSTTVDTTNHA